jgi:hypothetical protein
VAELGTLMVLLSSRLGRVVEILAEICAIFGRVPKIPYLIIKNIVKEQRSRSIKSNDV